MLYPGVHTPSQQSPPHQTQGAAGGVAAQPGKTSQL